MVLVRTIVTLFLGVATWYGPMQNNGDPFTAAYWHSKDCGPSIVDDSFLGMAVASRDIPFCTKIRLTVVNVPVWARPELNYLIGRSVVATVVDRLADPGGPVDFDLWPAAFRELAGDLDIGVLYVKAEVLISEVD